MSQLHPINLHENKSNDQIPLPLKLKRSNAFIAESNTSNCKPIIIISSKSLSNRAKDILCTAGVV